MTGLPIVKPEAGSGAAKPGGSVAEDFGQTDGENEKLVGRGRAAAEGEAIPTGLFRRAGGGQFVFQVGKSSLHSKFVAALVCSKSHARKIKPNL